MDHTIPPQKINTVCMTAAMPGHALCLVCEAAILAQTSPELAGLSTRRGKKAMGPGSAQLAATLASCIGSTSAPYNSKLPTIAVNDIINVKNNQQRPQDVLLDEITKEFSAKASNGVQAIRHAANVARRPGMYQDVSGWGSRPKACCCMMPSMYTHQPAATRLPETTGSTHGRMHVDLTVSDSKSRYIGTLVIRLLH